MATKIKTAFEIFGTEKENPNEKAIMYLDPEKETQDNNQPQAIMAVSQKKRPHEQRPSKPKTAKITKATPLTEEQNQFFKHQQEQDKSIEKFKKEMMLLNNDEIKDTLKENSNLRNSFTRDLETTGVNNALKKLKDDKETLEIKDAKSSQNPKEALSLRGAKKVANHPDLADQAVNDIAYSSRYGIKPEDYYGSVGSAYSNDTSKIVSANHMITEYAKTLPETVRGDVLRDYYELLSENRQKALSYARDMYDSNMSNTLKPSDDNNSIDDFDLWKSNQYFKGASGDEQDREYYNNLIETGTKYNSYLSDAEFDSYVKKGREIPWGPTLNDLKAGEPKDKRVKFDYMTQKERDLYAYIWGKFGEQESRNYLSFLEDDLTLRESNDKIKKAQEYAEEHPALATISTAPAAFVGDLQSLGNILGQTINEKVHPSLYKPDEVVLANNTINNRTDTITSTVSENIDNPVGKIAYNLGTTVYHEVVPQLVYSKIAPYMLFFDEIGDLAEESLKNGATKEQMTKNVLLNTAIDLAMNKFIDNDIISEVISQPIKSSAETSILKENSKYEQAIRNYNNLNPYEAQRYAVLNSLSPSIASNFSSYSATQNTHSNKNTESNNENNSKPKSIWDLTEEEFDEYINNILYQ